ncbi:hypothetical protein N7447_003494 [Penicillium robsamsonii]|uniref:uncharacterized protein n=1 Tax=Penicillium robsamsonii TaxID=1792511 RepID=UPI002547407C|nr:uncharacterized protein N7447_003494 [Penicillium robsamsonii]KAJ5826731.1 hypothetical protein N7447_003494 [Penicillium robsamsonii]
MDANGNMVPMLIKDLKAYEDDMWLPHTEYGPRISNGLVPYWSDDLWEDVITEDFGSKTYCTAPGQYLGVTQDQTEPASITLCPVSFKTPQAIDGLGSKIPKRGQSVDEFLPLNGTFSHEIFHLVMGVHRTPDATYEWKKITALLKKAVIDKESDDPKVQLLTNGESIRQNPETYVFFSVGYWYFLQTQWITDPNERWSFQSGSAAKPKLS